MKKVILYCSHLLPYGGVTTFVLNFCQRLAPHVSLLVLYNESDFNTICKVAEYCSIEKIQGNYTCESLVLATAWGFNPEKLIQSKKQIQVIHADYTKLDPAHNFVYQAGKKTTHHVAVGQNVSKTFKRAVGTDSQVIYNLLSPYTPKPKTESSVLRLITMSRISREKGFERMLNLCRLLKRRVKYRWDVYGDSTSFYGRAMKDRFPKEVKFHGVTDNTLELLNQADYCVQLSDTEGMPYSVQESLQAMTPVITTNYPAAYELIEHGKNGWILNMDLSNFKADMLKKAMQMRPYQEKSTEADWLEIL